MDKSRDMPAYSWRDTLASALGWLAVLMALYAILGASWAVYAMTFAAIGWFALCPARMIGALIGALLALIR